MNILLHAAQHSNSKYQKKNMYSYAFRPFGEEKYGEIFFSLIFFRENEKFGQFIIQSWRRVLYLLFSRSILYVVRMAQYEIFRNFWTIHEKAGSNVQKYETAIDLLLLLQFLEFEANFEFFSVSAYV